MVVQQILYFVFKIENDNEKKVVCLNRGALFNYNIYYTDNIGILFKRVGENLLKESRA